MIVSPTSGACNLSCEGCYASKYSTQSDMPAALFQRVVDEAADMGVDLITVLGGEPFIRTDLLEVIAANPETDFQIFTNGTLVTPAHVERLAKLGNAALMLSIEGDERTTDARRGPDYRGLLRPTHDPRRGRLRLFGYFGYGHRPTGRTPRPAMSSSILWWPRAPPSPGTPP